LARILVIDDEHGIRKLLSQALRNAGHIVATAENGIAALKICSIFPPDLAITDIIMPEKEGIETIMEIKEKFEGTRIIAMSGGGVVAAQDYLKIAELLGAEESYTKPLDLRGLVEKVHEMTMDSPFKAHSLADDSIEGNNQEP
jgi:DNA-binding response OmpR family regulator